MVYQGLREGLRAATKVEVLQYDEPTTQEIIIRVCRKEETLWGKRYSKYSLVEARASEYAVNESTRAAEGIIDGVLAEVDWDTFFETPEIVREEQDDRSRVQRRFEQYLRGE